MIKKVKVFLIVNFKTYTEATGKNAIKLAKICEKVAKETKTDIRIAVQTADLFSVSQAISLKVYTQHVDSYETGAHTGSISVSDIKKEGAKGSLLNHSEKRISLKKIKETIILCKKYKFHLCICVKNPKEAEKLALFSPHMIAVEPPSLIGGEISITSNPKIILETIKKVKKHSPTTKILVGAGIKNVEDIKKVVTLGANGVLLSSHVVLAKNPEKVLRKLASVF